MTAATKVKCPNCGKEGIKSLSMHEKHCIALHPELAEPPPENEVFEAEVTTITGEMATVKAFPTESKGFDLEKQEDLDKLVAMTKEQSKTQDIVVDTKEVRIGKILYSDIVKPLCEEYGIELREWEEIDQSDYFKIAGRILSAIKEGE